MKHLTTKLHNISLTIAVSISIVFTAILFFSTLIFSFYAEDMTTQISVPHVDNILLSILLLLAVFGTICRLNTLSLSTLEHIHKILRILSPLYTLILGALLVIFGRSAPAADAHSVYSIAESFATNNLSAIQPTGDTYLSYYPQQIGLISYYELICRLWNLLPLETPAYHIIKCGNVLFACLIVIYQYRTIHILTNNLKADVIYLVLSLFNFPLIFYSSFVYGEVPSFACISIGIYYLLKAEKNLQASASIAPELLLSLLSLTIAVLLRKNSLVLIIAVALTVFCRWFFTKKHLLLGFALAVCLTSVSILPLIQNIYESRADNHLLPGVPATSYFAMGMQESDRGNGWYNGFNFYTYQEQNLDSEATILLSQNAIAERMDHFKENPTYAIRFYTDKYLSQWTDGTYACRQATIQSFSQRPSILQSIYDGSLANVFSSFCNHYQLIVFFGAFAYSIFGRKKEESQWTLLLYIGFIGAFGGLLFHTIWEANSRYILPYGMLLIPYAAMGLAHIPQPKSPSRQS